jgi:malate dehydrogenase
MSHPTSLKRIAVSGAAGQICFSLLFRLASGDLFGSQQPIELRLVDLPQAQATLRGIVMEVEDCALPLVENMVTMDDPAVAFDNADVIFFVGSRPRSKGMERRDLLSANAKIFELQGRFER